MREKMLKIADSIKAKSDEYGEHALTTGSETARSNAMVALVLLEIAQIIKLELES